MDRAMRTLQEDTTIHLGNTPDIIQQTQRTTSNQIKRKVNDKYYDTRFLRPSIMLQHRFTIFDMAVIVWLQAG